MLLPSKWNKDCHFAWKMDVDANVEEERYGEDEKSERDKSESKMKMRQVKTRLARATRKN